LKPAVVYYSLTGNTKFVAQKIAEQLTAELIEVVDKKNRGGKLNYLTGGTAAYREQLTDIEISKPIGEYDLIVVGSPVWAGKITPAIRKFWVSNDFSNKQVAFFVTLGGDKPEKSLQNIKEMIKPKTLIGELAITTALENQAETENKVTDWCAKFKNP
jgi:flavodoxin